MAGRVLSKKNESALRAALEALTDVLGQVGDDASDEAKEAHKGLLEAANLGDNLEARLHMQFVATIDDLFAFGKLTRDERQVMLGALEMALQSFAASVQEQAPQVYDRLPWADAPETADLGEKSASAEQAIVVESDVVPLVERAVRPDGTARIRIISAGWGSSGYYPAEVLERDGPRIFTAGVKQFWDHATPTEDAERPEGTLTRLAGELVTDARWEPDNPAGPGLYADTKVFAPYQEVVEELAPHIGVSIRALGRAAQGEAEGRKGPVIQALTAARSIDYVTTPGANGRIVEMFESVGRGRGRGRLAAPAVQSNQEAEMDQKVQEALAAANARAEKAEQDAARFAERLLVSEARGVVERALANAALADATKARLAGSLAQNPPSKDGLLDEAALAQRIEAAIKAEVEYLGKVAGSGRVVGMGAAPQAAPAEGDAQKRMQESFERMGLSAKAAQVAAAGRG